MTCIDYMSKRSKMLSYVANHSKQRKTTKPIKLQWIASIVCQNDQNNAKLQKQLIYNDLHRLYVKTIKNVELRRKPFKTTQNYKTNQITMNCIDWMSKRSKQRKTTKVIKLQWLASIICQNDQNKAKLQKWSKSNDLHRFDVKTIKNVELRRKTFKTTQNYKTDQITLNCIDWMVKRSNNAKLQKWSKSNDLHRFDVKTIKNVELRRKTFKTTQNYKTDQITLNCIDWMVKRSNNAKLQKWSKPNDLHRFDIKTIKTKLNYKSDQNPMTCIDLTSKRSKMLSYVAKHSKQRKTTKPIKLQWIASIGCQNDQTTQNYKNN